MLNLSTLVEEQARIFPHREAIVFGSMRLTYGRLDAMACRVANSLRAQGIGPGDHVALSCPNIPLFPIAYYGILKTGAAVVPLNVLLKGHEIAYHLRDSQARLYLCFEGTAELPMARMGYDGFREAQTCRQIVVMTSDDEGPSPLPNVPTLGALTRDQPETFVTADCRADDTAVILYTSGTTGRSKGAELTHANMILNAIVSRDIQLPKMGAERNVALVALPLFHSFGQTVQMNAMFYHGATVVLVARFDPKVVLETMLRERVNLFAGVPTMYWGLLTYARQHGVDTAPIAQHLRLCLSGGASIPVELLNAFEHTFGVPILEGYGLSETAPVASFNRLGLARKPGSIGLPVFATDIRVVDDQDRDAPVGERGEIVIRGHCVMRGYYHQPEATAEAMRGGWFHTGDVAYQDADGYLYVVDRKKDVILRGGYNVYPREVEEVLMTHPDVSLAAVVGVPHPSLGEEVKAFVVRNADASATEDALIAFCKEQMASFKYPRSLEFREQLPMTATGKILKRELRDAEARRQSSSHEPGA